MTIADSLADWSPSPQRRADSTLGRYLAWARDTGRCAADDYDELWAWSVTELSNFWSSLWDFFDISPPRPVDVEPITDKAMPGTRWFAGAELNYAHNALRHPADRLALVACDEAGQETGLTYGVLREQVAAAAGALRAAGIGSGDRVAAVLPNRVEAVVAFLATASIGAIWALCAPEFGVSSIVGRLAQLEPAALIATDGYTYKNRSFDIRDTIGQVRAQLPSLTVTVHVPSRHGAEALPASQPWADLLCGPAVSPEPVPFEHPLWVLYSSGTTGIPKAMVHSHGGIVLEHVKNVGLHTDVRPGDRFFWYTTTAWMMWNFLVGALLVGATAVLYDGPPLPEALWPLVKRLDIDVFGASPGFFQATQDGALLTAGPSLRVVGSTGSPLLAHTHRWLIDSLGPEVHVAPVSGGTDVCSGFVGPSSLLPAWVGEMQCRMLGVACTAFGEDGAELFDEIGELVVTEPMPSMPVALWADADGSRLRQTYYTKFPGVWRHGDWIRFTGRGSAVIYGRSDSTLNRGGVRMGTSEFYGVLAEITEITDSLVVDTSRAETSTGKLLLFVVTPEGLDTELLDRVRRTIRTQLSPRHVPDAILPVGEIPYTLTGKKCEIPVKRILQGIAVGDAVDLQSLRNPGAIGAIVSAATI